MSHSMSIQSAERKVYEVDFTPGAKDRQWRPVSEFLLRSLKTKLLNGLSSYIKSQLDQGNSANELTEALKMLIQLCKNESNAANFLDAVCDKVAPQAAKNSWFFHHTSGHLLILNTISDLLSLRKVNISGPLSEATTLVNAMIANDEADQNQRLESVERQRKLSAELKESIDAGALLLRQSEAKDQKIQEQQQSLAKAEKEASEAKLEVTRLRSENETLHAKDAKKDASPSRKRKSEEEEKNRERDRLLLRREMEAEQTVKEYSSKLSILEKQQASVEKREEAVEKREEAVGKRETDVIRSQAQVLSISQRLSSQSQPSSPAPSPVPSPRHALHAVRTKTELERIQENLSPLRYAVVQKLIPLIKSGNKAAYTYLEELLVDIANKTDKRTADIMRSWQDSEVRTALSDLSSALSDVNRYSGDRDRTLHSFVILLEKKALLGEADCVLSRKIAKYSPGYPPQSPAPVNSSSSQAASYSIASSGFVPPLPRTPSARLLGGDRKQ